ncbi:Trans-resveratrol di-O-methyltransferase [Capsicum annuum]|uniref:Myricetin 7/4'-O-methyltransferase 2 n=2 Tax=Capsicum annuum TaxID=4072 RepID=A0A2G2Z860_CAPAN|nr:Trans-resveratrol di-O-methyltransferase [Capsicum annuum]KAF3632255.1 Trans-resveratrol di-O-methyltransferase [Capsicum annuum]PHT78192.1 Trans-resveratrol di-O-methyltransferase [Capsicum annuum]
MLASQAHMWNHTFNYINSMSLKCAIQLGIPDIIHSHGQAMTLSNLVAALPINNNAKTLDYIFRLMRFLIHAGFLSQTQVNDKEEEGYLLTPASRLLLKDEPLCQIPFVQMELEPHFMDPWHSLSQWIKNGNDSSTPFAICHVKPLFEYDEKKPKINRQFNEIMASDSRLIMSVVIEHCKAVFEGLKSLVDVGGCPGIVAKIIANALPEIDCIVFDLPHVIEGCEGSKNLSYVEGDMFKSIPSIDEILLKWVLHDWGDEGCIKILKECKEAIPSKEKGGKVIIIDMVLTDHKLQKGDDKSYETQLFFDMLMMVHVSGKERNQQDWAKLFSGAGFGDYNIIPVLGLRSIIEVFPLSVEFAKLNKTPVK